MDAAQAIGLLGYLEYLNGSLRNFIALVVDMTELIQKVRV